ncbi:MmcB family DNA repair protein [Bacillus sp. JCM 19034]|uniref:MmcB family DNA repair protein n=1 Tax=Bacillus sp. JCM 19034 TaxID=1481928 RepID=UPI000780B482|nr:MmcB family DNA repair protein [Bacillus sp. JCM 19034]
MESHLHKHLKKESLYWLKEKMTDLCANEVKLFVRRKRVIADAVGINMKRKEVRIIEVKTSRQDFLRDETLYSEYGYHHLAHYCYLLTPENLLALEELPKGYGLLEIDEFDKITVKRKPTKNQKPFLKLETIIKRTGRAATNTLLYKELSYDTKDVTSGAFSKGATIFLISATCPQCKQRNKYLIEKGQQTVECLKKSCQQTIPLDKARVHTVTGYNQEFLRQILHLSTKEDKELI